MQGFFVRSIQLYPSFICSHAHTLQGLPVPEAWPCAAPFLWLGTGSVGCAFQPTEMLTLDMLLSALIVSYKHLSFLSFFSFL